MNRATLQSTVIYSTYVFREGRTVTWTPTSSPSRLHLWWLYMCTRPQSPDSLYSAQHSTSETYIRTLPF